MFELLFENTSVPRNVSDWIKLFPDSVMIGFYDPDDEESDEKHPKRFDVVDESIVEKAKEFTRDLRQKT